MFLRSRDGTRWPCVSQLHPYADRKCRLTVCQAAGVFPLLSGSGLPVVCPRRRTSAGIGGTEQSPRSHRRLTGSFVALLLGEVTDRFCCGVTLRL